MKLYQDVSWEYLVIGTFMRFSKTIRMLSRSFGDLTVCTCNCLKILNSTFPKFLAHFSCQLIFLAGNSMLLFLRALWILFEGNLSGLRLDFGEKFWNSFWPSPLLTFLNSVCFLVLTFTAYLVALKILVTGRQKDFKDKCIHSSWRYMDFELEISVNVFLWATHCGVHIPEQKSILKLQSQ